MRSFLRMKRVVIALLSFAACSSSDDAAAPDAPAQDQPDGGQAAQVPAPRGLRVTPAGSDLVVSWDPPSAPVMQYLLYEGVDGATPSLATASANATATRAGVAGSTYCYRVSGMLDERTSTAMSATACARVSLPGEFTVTISGYSTRGTTQGMPGYDDVLYTNDSFIIYPVSGLDVGTTIVEVDAQFSDSSGTSYQIRFSDGDVSNLKIGTTSAGDGTQQILTLPVNYKVTSLASITISLQRGTGTGSITVQGANVVAHN